MTGSGTSTALGQSPAGSTRPAAGAGLLVSPALNRQVAWAGPVHINADFAGQTSDHDPLLAYFNAPR
jgi:hypothetical protein